MRTSEQISTLVAALVKARSAFPGIREKRKVSRKTRDGRAAGEYSYAPLEDVLASINKPLLENDLVVIQIPDENTVITRLAHASGEWIEGSTPIHIRDAGAQNYGSGVSYARRYALLSILNIATEDDDGASASSQKTKNSNGKAAAPLSEQAAAKEPARKKLSPEEVHARARSRVDEMINELGDVRTPNSYAAAQEAHAESVEWLRKRFPALHGEYINTLNEVSDTIYNASDSEDGTTIYKNGALSEQIYAGSG